MPLDFANSFNDWTPDYADYLPGQEALIGFSTAIEQVPANVSGFRGLRLRSQNRSDDVSMYIWKRVEGLVPGGRYRVETELRIATNALAGCAGAGGAPGEAVVIKAGATPRPPAKGVDERGRISVNFDKGDQITGGTEVATIGDIATPNALSCLDGVYALKTLTSGQRSVTVSADSSGRLWLVLATDSGFEGTTSVYLIDGQLRLTRL